MFEDLGKYRAVYFMECKDFIKIGRCKLLNLYRRRSELQGGNPFKLKVLGVIVCETGVKKKRAFST